MSFNLQLTATRQVFTKSGREVTQTENIDLFQTPTIVTNKLLDLGEFDAVLNGYIEWVEQNCIDPNEAPYSFWYPIFEEEEIDNLKSGIVPEKYSGYEIGKIAKSTDIDFNNVTGEWGELELIMRVWSDAIAFVKLQDASYRKYFENKIKKYKDDEWELEFYSL